MLQTELLIMSKLPLKEIEELVVAGIIPQETAAKINNYYQEKKQSAPNTFVIILGIIGALLSGSGIILIVAHNWDELSIPVKTFLAFLPLIIAQVVCGYTLIRRKSDRVWIECSSMILFFSIGACISMISQIYHVDGSLPEFLLVWVLLSLPVTYFLPANTVVLFCIATITWYVVEKGYFDRYSNIPFMYVVILAITIPHYLRLYKRSRESNFYTLLNWFGAISITITLGAFAGKGSNFSEWIFLLYCILFCIWYVIGRLSFFESQKIFTNPFLVIGTLGIIITLLTWSFSFLWKEYHLPPAREIVSFPLFYLIAAGLVVVSFMIWKTDRFQIQKLIDPMGYSFAVLLLLMLFFYKVPSIAVFIINAWTIFIAVFFIRKGSAKNHLGIVNFGLIIIAALAVCRFFDDRIPFVWRGVFFLVTGATFFAANYLLLRRRKLQAFVKGI